ncbi:MAG: aldo/keto reductase [Gammaproteobacteria bacterium]|nr:aldo/keto reductase [Gammaproteobacteria bacterium]
MRSALLGRLQVSALGLGCMGMSQAYGDADLAESERTLHRALDLGITFLDTANVYGVGHNENLIGRVLKARRSQLVLATKFGIIVGEKGARGVNGRPEQVAERCEESLKRLQTDVIDLYYLHRVDPEVPIEETVGAMAALVKSGKVRHLGLSEVSATNLRRAHAVHPITAVQSEYSLWTRDVEAKVLPTCRELGIGFVPFSPLGRAVLTGAIRGEDSLTGPRDMRSTMPRFQGENLKKNLELVDALADIAASRHVSRGQLALAWLLAKGSDIAPIPGTKRVRYLEENVAAAEIILNAEEVSRLDQLFAADKVAGARYNEAGMRSLDRD